MHPCSKICILCGKLQWKLGPIWRFATQFLPLCALKLPFREIAISPQPGGFWSWNLVHLNRESKANPWVPVSASELAFWETYSTFSASQITSTWLFLVIPKKKPVAHCFTHKSTWFDHLAAWVMMYDTWPCPWSNINLSYMLVVVCLQVGVILGIVHVLYMMCVNSTILGHTTFCFLWE